MKLNYAKVNHNLDRAFPVQLAALAMLVILLGGKNSAFFLPLGLLISGTVWRYYILGAKYRQ